MNHPAEEVGKDSAGVFREALASQLQRCCEMADKAAFTVSEEEGMEFRSSLGTHFNPESRPRGDEPPGSGGGKGESSGKEEGGDTPAYKGGPTSSNAESWMKFAQSPREEGGLGLTKAQAAGVVGNLQHESGPNIKPYGVTGDHGTAHGAAQWRHGRFAALKAHSEKIGLDWRTTEAQQRFMRHELDTSEKGADTALRAARTPEEAAHVFNRRYERSADPGSGRRASARHLYERGDKPTSEASTLPSKPANRATAEGLRASPGRSPNLSRVDPRLREIVNAGASHLPEGYTVGVNEGYNAHGHAPHSQHKSAHGALDVSIFDPKGNKIPNRGRDVTGMYTRLGRAAYGEMLARHPDLKGRFAHGASFGVTGGSNVPDLMHFDLGGERGHLAPHLSKLGPLPGEKYGEPEKEKTAEGSK
jgi:hypothetical protein